MTAAQRAREMALVCLSLERRKDRQFVFERTFPGFRDLPVVFFPAVDSELVPDWKIEGLRSRYALAEITARNWAVRLSKRLVLREFLQSGDGTLLFMEDDVLFRPEFAGDCELLLREMPPDWDLAFLGGQNPSDPLVAASGRPQVQPSPPTADNHGVLFSRAGAAKVLRLLGRPTEAYSDQEIKVAVRDGMLSAWWTGRYTAVQRGSASDNSGDRFAFVPGGGMMAGPDDAWLLAAAITPGDIVLEWGSGGSTCLLARGVGVEGRVVSFEHQREYFEATRARLDADGMSDRVDLHYVPARPLREADGPWRMLPGQMEAYVEAPRTILPAGGVSVAFVDGRERMRCAQVALDLLRPSGLLLIHDFWGRPRYRERIPDILARADLVCSTPQRLQAGVVSDLALFRKRSSGLPSL